MNAEKPYRSCPTCDGKGYRKLRDPEAHTLYRGECHDCNGCGIQIRKGDGWRKMGW